MKKNAHADCQSRTQSPLSFRTNLGFCNSHHSPTVPPPKIGKIAVLFYLKSSWNHRKTNRFLAKFAQKMSAKLAFFNDRFSAKFVPNFPAKFPRNRPFFGANLVNLC